MTANANTQGYSKNTTQSCTFGQVWNLPEYYLGDPGDEHDYNMQKQNGAHKAVLEREKFRNGNHDEFYHHNQG